MDRDKSISKEGKQIDDMVKKGSKEMGIKNLISIEKKSMGPQNLHMIFNLFTSVDCH